LLSKLYVPVESLRPLVAWTAATTCSRVGMLPPAVSIARLIASRRIFAQS